MVILILTRPGFDDIRPRIDPQRDPVWLNAGVLSQPEVAELRAARWNLTTFANPLDPTDLASDIATLRLHHPDQVIWAETPAG